MLRPTTESVSLKAEYVLFVVGLIVDALMSIMTTQLEMYVVCFVVHVIGPLGS